ncbi:MAG TPA: response regulator [Polyangia bacterium]|jgi:CheY-like chemotaxis protein
MQTATCPACGVVVEVVIMTMGTGVDAAEVARCPHCGFSFAAEAAPPPASTLYPRVAVADDVEHVRQAVARSLVAERLAADVDQFSDGSHFIGAVRARSREGCAYQLVILDLQMPVIDGVKAAHALRQMERQHGWPPTPILFFSALVCDDRLRGLLKTLRPGFYLNKATITSQADLSARLRELLWYLAGRGRS